MTDLATGLSEENRALIESVTGLTSQQGFLLGLDSMNRLLDAARAQGPRQDGEEWLLVRRSFVQAVADLESADGGRSFPSKGLCSKASHYLSEPSVSAPRQDGDFVLVPREPTPAMVCAGDGQDPGFGSMSEKIWRAMLSASPVHTLPEVGGSSRDHALTTSAATPDGAAKGGAE